MSVCLFPGAAVPRPSAALFPPLPITAVCLNVSECECQGDQSAHQSPVVKDSHSLLLFTDLPHGSYVTPAAYYGHLPTLQKMSFSTGNTA